MTQNLEIRALTFDVFGTVVDWRGSIIAEGERFNRDWGLSVNWAAFADAWRGCYQPSMEAVRTGKRPWAILDDLHRESLEALLEQFEVKGLNEEQIDHLNRVWRRLRPWSDVVSGLTRLKQKYTLATLSNGNVALLVNMAKHSRLPWDVILGAEVAQHYKPQPEAYLTTARMLGLRPEQCLMVAAHNGDLGHAASHGFRTAFIYRPTEYGPEQRTDLEPNSDFDWIARGFGDLAEQLGC